MAGPLVPALHRTAHRGWLGSGKCMAAMESRTRSMQGLRDAFRLFKAAAIAWNDDNISIHGAALAYYTVFSIAPLMLAAIAIAGFIFGVDASRGQVFGEIQGLLGPEGAQSVQSLVVSAARTPHAGVIATTVAFATLLVGASGVFQQLQLSLNIIWRVTTQPGRGVWVFLRRRLLTFSMIAVIGFVLLVSLLVGVAISALGGFMGDRLPGGEMIWHLAHSLVSFGVTTVLFAAVLKVLPDVVLRWRDVWLGSAVTAFLFTVGKLLIGLYLGHSGVTSAYGAAGSLVVVLLWVFYASQILYFGAEFTRARVTERGGRPVPKDGAALLEANPQSPIETSGDRRVA